MSKFFVSLVLLSFISGMACVPAFATITPAAVTTFKNNEPSLSTVREVLNQVPASFTARLGRQVVDNKIQLAKGTYDFGKVGGASVLSPSTFGFILRAPGGGDLVLPKGAVVKTVLIDIVAPLAPSASSGFTAPQISLGINTNNDLLASTLVTNFAARFLGTPQGTSTTMVKVSAISAVQMNLAFGSVIRGKFNAFIEYYLSE